jgi:hypothetical protein
MGRMFEIGK